MNTTTHSDTLTVLAQTIESLQPVDAPPTWVEIIGPLIDPEGVRWHPDPDGIVGYVAPPDCQAIVTVGSGWVRSLAGPGEPAPRVAGPLATLAPGERRRCRVVSLVTRTGDLGGYLRQGSTIVLDTPPDVGRIPDLMRRALGLPTPPPDEPTDRFLAYLWLNNVLGRARQAPAPLTWRQVRGRHPVVQVAEEAGLAIPASELTSILRSAARTWSWGYLARQAAQPGWLCDLLPAGAGGWMDEGILSRWLLDGLCQLDWLLAEVSPWVAPPAAQRLRRILNQLGVLSPRHPGDGCETNT